MDYLSDADLFSGYAEAGLAQCLRCKSLYKLNDGGCDFCAECGEEEVEKIAA